MRLFDGRLYHGLLLQLLAQRAAALPPPAPGLPLVPMVAGFAVPAAPAIPVALAAAPVGVRDLVFVQEALKQEVVGPTLILVHTHTLKKTSVAFRTNCIEKITDVVLATFSCQGKWGPPKC